MHEGQDQGRIICLTNVYDGHYRDARGEDIPSCLSAPKRRDLFRCLELATGRKVIVLSSPPKATGRRGPKWLPGMETFFSVHPQFYCPIFDAPKIRVPLGWLFYALHVARHVRDGDIVMLDNYELLYVIAAWWTRLFRRVNYVLDYEDGKHLIDRSWIAVLSDLAEKLGKPIIRAALLAHPALGDRLPPGIPSIMVPGFVLPSVEKNSVKQDAGVVNFIYSGSLDSTRGVDLLLDAVPLLPENRWHLHITGSGPLGDKVAGFANDPRWCKKITFHGVVPGAAYGDLMNQCHVGLNCQRVSDPVSGVTFPSKIFTYISAGLLVVSSRASDVPAICGDACVYFDEEKSASLAAAMAVVMAHCSGEKRRESAMDVARIYNLEGTAERIGKLFKEAQIL